MQEKKSSSKGGLGKGLDVLFSGSNIIDETPKASTEKKEELKKESDLLIDIDKIKTNPYQPREEFDEEALKELSDSIRQKGVIQAITVRKLEDGTFELIAGERRLRASKLAGLTQIPAMIKDVTTKEDLLEMSLIENIQRKDLNAVEVALGYKRLIDECSLTQEEVATKVGKSRAAVTNFLRILRLPEEIKQSIRKGELSEGHARAILSVNDEFAQITIWKRILSENLSVRKAEEISKKIRKPREKKIFTATTQDQAAINFLESKFREHFGTRVKIHPKTNKSGEIIIEYYTPEDLERIVDLCRKK